MWQVENLVHNEMMLLWNELQNSERHLAQVTTNHCFNDNEPLQLYHFANSLTVCCSAVKNSSIVWTVLVATSPDAGQ